MPTPVKVSDRLMAWAKEAGPISDRSATAQIEHWAILGRAVEFMATYREILALKKAGRALPLPTFVRPEDVREVLMSLLSDTDRTAVKEWIGRHGGALYEADPERPEVIIEVRPDGTRSRGRMEGRRFVPDPE
jgi:hypothetical protein